MAQHKIVINYAFVFEVDDENHIVDSVKDSLIAAVDGCRIECPEEASHLDSMITSVIMKKPMLNPGSYLE